jgi:hypothetical protein
MATYLLFQTAACKARAAADADGVTRYVIQRSALDCGDPAGFVVVDGYDLATFDIDVRDEEILFATD